MGVPISSPFFITFLTLGSVCVAILIGTSIFMFVGWKKSAKIAAQMKKEQQQQLDRTSTPAAPELVLSKPVDNVPAKSSPVETAAAAIQPRRGPATAKPMAGRSGQGRHSSPYYEGSAEQGRNYF